MNINRRQAIKAGMAIAAGIPLTGCESVYSHFSKELGAKVPSSLDGFESESIDPAFHLLSRAAYGPWPGDVEKVSKQGADAWIEEQLQPEKIDDRACDLRAHRFETLFVPPGSCYDWKKEKLRLDIVRHTLLRAVYSKRQLFEIMVGFWTDHLNISLDKGDCVYLKPSDDQLVIRAHAFGKFKDLIRQSATSPAMLVYLDGKENKRSGPTDVPNENYARELLELHTMGVHGGYTQKDVCEVARCLTGWCLHDSWQRAKVFFDSARHDNGEKRVLGHTIPAGGGESDLQRVIDIVCRHPSTALFISKKLAHKFVNDPSDAFIRKIADIFVSTDGDIKSMLRFVLKSDEFKNDRGTKFKRPFNFVASSLRAIGADTHAHEDLIEYLQRMGQSPFQYPTPDGYPDKPEFWMGTLLWRWKFALAVTAGKIASVKPDIDGVCASLGLKGMDESQLTKLFSHFNGRIPNANELKPLEQFAQSKQASAARAKPELAGLILCSPAFQRY